VIFAATTGFDSNTARNRSQPRRSCVEEVPLTCVTCLVHSASRPDPDLVTNEDAAGGASAGPPNFGLPEHSALTVEGRIERAGGVGMHGARVRDGRERPLRQSSWAGGLSLIVGGFALLLAVLVVLYLIG
jgi:hypothetical protein